MADITNLKGFAKVKAELLNEIEYLKKQNSLLGIENNQLNEELELINFKISDIDKILESTNNLLAEKNEYINLLELRLKQTENA